uniref:NADH-ubiquinone oxidoreductase chain 5 n=1 Tax=Amblyomma geoemydae TaxID=1325863 RepID=A0A5P8FTA3_9ACAR|nr:NADH dehydrogenase subunit 5 [Amblyomma geoemydae]
MFIIWGLLLIMLSLMKIILFMILFKYENMLEGEYFLSTIFNMDIKFYFVFDWMSSSFSFIVLMISSMVMFYSHSYMNQDKNKNLFCLVLLLFVLSMILLILMPNMFMLILGWDGLGLVSYCLVIHYQSVNSYNSGMMTIISNRVGDVMIILSLIFFVNFGSFDLMTSKKIELICGILILMAALTKSAQIPFSAWLPAAMAAPTPVSSLVHSSTLVTAGVYLLMRFNLLFKVNFFSLFLLKISLLTMLMAGFNAFFENDFKKIIAFSTLSQLSMMMVAMSLNMMELAFFHLIMHAIFKSMLFLCAGLIIHSFQGIQDIRMLGNFFNISPCISSCMVLAMLSLMGFPFLGGFYSKDLILEFFVFKMNNLILILIFYLGIALTFFYCSRLTYMLLLKSTKNLCLTKFSMDFFMILPILFLCFTMLISGSMLNWMIFSNFSTIFITMEVKYFTMFLMIVSLYLFFIFMKMKNIGKSMDFFFNIWNLSFLTSYILMIKSKKMSMVSMSDWTWMELMGPSMVNNNLNKFWNFFLMLEIKNFNKILLILVMLLLISLI